MADTCVLLACDISSCCCAADSADLADSTCACGGPVFGLRVIEFLLRDQSGTRLVGLLQPRGVGMQRRILRLVARHFVLRALHFLLAVPNAGAGALQLRHQFRNFEHRQHLAGLHPVTDVHVDLADVARRPWRAFRFPGKDRTLPRR